MTDAAAFHPKKLVTWAQYAQWAKLAFDRVRLGQDGPPKLVTGPARGGLIVAVMASHYFDAKFISLELALAMPWQFQHDLLWCDDIVDSGETMRRTTPSHLYGKCAVIARRDPAKDSKGAQAGHYIQQNDPTWFVFPYERADAPTAKDETV